MSRIMLTIIVGLTLLTLMFGYLSYRFNAEKRELEVALSNATAANASLVKGVENAYESCKIGDVLGAENTKGQKELDEKKEGIISEIEDIPRTPKPKVGQLNVGEQDEQNNVADIDARLPASVLSLLNESYNSGKGQSTLNP